MRTVFHRRGNQGPERESIKIARGVSDRGATSAFGRGDLQRLQMLPPSAPIPSWHPRILEALLWEWAALGRGRVGEKLAAGSARPGFSTE